MTSTDYLIWKTLRNEEPDMNKVAELSRNIIHLPTPNT